ncbi:unnamed protein product [Prunus armeniaca]|uniref:Uncharacterized protein n=1 Tax=Prunus armeniaca TaxID=36596 RepID=A0A6J5VYD8_PRUAR|nr:unnamed protein product [Prunus armeniaca]
MGDFYLGQSAATLYDLMCLPLLEGLEPPLSLSTSENPHPTPLHLSDGEEVPTPPPPPLLCLAGLSRFFSRSIWNPHLAGPKISRRLSLVTCSSFTCSFLRLHASCVDDLESGGVGISRVMFITQTLTLPSRPGCISWIQRPIQNAISCINLGRCVELCQCYGSGACTTFFLFHGFGSLGFGLI